MDKIKIAYCMMGMNAMYWIRDRFNEMVTHVDRMIYIDGGSIDDSIVYTRNRGDVEMYIHPWNDDYGQQRNRYLHYANSGDSADWIIVSDHDECFSKYLLSELRGIIAEAEKEGCNKIDVQCMLTYMRGDKTISEELRPFWKPLIFKNEKGLHYEGSPHETFHNPNGWKEKKIGDKYLHYSHIRQENIVWPKGARNFVVSGGAMMYDKNPHYVEFKEALEKDGHSLDSVLFNQTMVNGTVGTNTTQWILDHKDIDDPTLPDCCCSEMRECYLTYFKLYHPEKELI